MKKLFYLGLVTLIMAVGLLTSCEEDTTIHVYPEEKEVSLEMVNLISTTGETIGGKSASNVDPYCSIEDNLVVPYTGEDEIVRVTFISKIIYNGQFIGYKWRLRNGTNEAVTNVKVGLSGGTEVAELSQLDANTEIFLFTQNSYGGVSIKWDGGSKGTSSSNETEVEGCVPEQETCTIDEEPMEHNIPDTFNVFFIPTNNEYESFEFNDVTEGTATFNIPAVEYTVTVTNYEDKEGLPLRSENLYLIGEKTINFGSTVTGTILIDNPYSSIQVVKADDITETPTIITFPGDMLKHTLSDNHEVYYHIYSKVEGNENLQISHTRDYETVAREFEPNRVYRFKVCKESLLDLSSNVFPDGSTDIVLD